MAVPARVLALGAACLVALPPGAAGTALRPAATTPPHASPLAPIGPPRSVAHSGQDDVVALTAPPGALVPPGRPGAPTDRPSTVARAGRPGPNALAGRAGPAAPARLARSGRLAARSCAEPPLVWGNVPRTREYLEAITKCLEKSWSAHFARAGLAFEKPVVRFYEEPEQRVCGVRWPSSASAFYCTERGTLVFLLTGDWIEDRTDLYPLKVAAHEYGHHVQSLTGIRRHYEARIRADHAHHAELGRRYELQADCLSGVFIGSVWGSLSRSGDDWAAVVETTRATGDDDERRSHGKGANRAYWLKRGFTAVSPAACDTWKAAPSRVS
ncbi:neutral zinc metallopeptidase [Nonomuraea sp. NPDC048916]|uniref:neutral zinc metallopeptidase n=1 Tax=Nonomuraea sp. NPDC048916 TaxID=3154232 RepID=UPI0033F01DFA